MKIFEGKSPTEKKKLIAAFVLGGLALFVLAYNLIGMFSGGRKTTVSVTVSPTPTATASSRSGGGGSSSSSQMSGDAIQTLNQEQLYQEYTITPVVYTGAGYAPDAGRNIFAFYEPPAPTPYVPTPIPVKTVPPTPPPTPAPPPPMTLAHVSPQSVYAGSKSFRLEVNGDLFTPDSVIVWDGSQLPTTFVSPQKLTASISPGQIAGEGQRTIMVRTPDGVKFSNQVMLTVEAPPKPNFQYIGLMARSRSNNDTATLMEANKQNATPFNVRLNDIVGGRFRTVSISVSEVILEDTTLGFRHRIPIVRADSSGAPTGVGPGGRTGGGFGDRVPGGRFPQQQQPSYQPPPPSTYNPTMPGNTIVPQEIPGIPNNIPRAVPHPGQQQKTPPKPDDDDEDGDGY